MARSWLATVIGDEHHVIPMKDLREHDEHQRCWCRPAIEPEVGFTLVVHHSLDGRERVEPNCDPRYQEIPN